MAKEDKKEEKKELTGEEKAKLHHEELVRKELEACEKNKLSNELDPETRLPAFKDGKAYYIIGDEYVLQEDADVLFKEMEIERLQGELKTLKEEKK